MVESMILGFHDVLRNKRIYIIFQVCLVIICSIVILATSSLLRELNNVSTTEAEEFSKLNTVIPISYDMSANPEVVNDINQLLRNGGKSFFFSEHLTNQSEFPTYIVIDSELNQLIESVEETDGASFAKVYSQINPELIIDIDFPEPTEFESTDVSRFDERIFDTWYQDEVVIVLLQTNQLDKWIATDHGLEIIELVENTAVKKSKEEELVAKIEFILEDSFLSHQSSNYKNEEISFLTFYVYPTVGFVIIALFISLVIVYVSLFKKLYREYTIHLISGATLKHIFARNSVFIIALIIVCLLIISFLNGFQVNDRLGITLAILTFVFIVFEGLLYLTLTRKNLSMTLRGDD